MYKNKLFLTEILSGYTLGIDPCTLRTQIALGVRMTEYGTRRDPKPRYSAWLHTFGESKWWASAILAFFDEDSDIDFYDTEIALVGVSVFRRF